MIPDPNLLLLHQTVSNHRADPSIWMPVHLPKINPSRYRSLSAFSPVVAPTRAPWGRRAFRGYLGDEETRWLDHDACHLVTKAGWTSPVLVDQGTADEFLDIELQPDLFERACADAGVSLTLRRQPGYDHSYYFISTFMGDHIGHHARLLAAER